MLIRLFFRLVIGCAVPSGLIISIELFFPLFVIDGISVFLTLRRVFLNGIKQHIRRPIMYFISNKPLVINKTTGTIQVVGG